MKAKIIISLSILISSFGCSSFSNKEPLVDSTKYYYGEVTTTSADGVVPYGPVITSLVKRIVDSKANMITEIVKQDGQTIYTELKQDGGSNSFSVADKTNMFEGVVLFNEENWNSWTYDIVMKNKSGKIVGTGAVNAEGITTEKYFVNSKDVKTVKIIDKLKEITEEEYNKLNLQ
jgi:hypothetical protein